MKIYKREKYLQKIRPFYKETEIIKVITGIRRCGKSSLMQSIRDEIAKSGVRKEDIIYIDLDAYEYKDIVTVESLDKVIKNKTVSKRKQYLFIDEIQNVSGFEKLINFYRLSGKYSIFITGSNSYLLSGELVTKLTGRYIEFELFTLSFLEYICMKKFYKKKISSDKKKEMIEYISSGGFPFCLKFKTDNEKRIYVKALLMEIISKDIKKRINIKNFEAFDKVMNYMINNFGVATSINNICKGLLQDGLSVKRMTINKYINALTDAKILIPVDRFDMKSKRALMGDKKYYIADTSIYFSHNADNRINYGPILENIIYVYLRSKGYDVSIGRIGKLECDFIVHSDNHEYVYIQVAYTIFDNKKTEDREYAPLEKIKDNYKKYIFTLDDFIQKRNGIIHKNIIDFILNEEKL